MDSSDLKPEQIAAILSQVQKQLHYIHKLAARMQKMRWPMEDRLCAATHETRIALERMRSAVMDSGRKL